MYTHLQSMAHFRRLVVSDTEISVVSLGEIVGICNKYSLYTVSLWVMVK